TQLTLKTFHSGGVAGEDITTGLPRVEELFEVRTPKGQAYLADISGTITAYEEGDHYVVQVAAKEDTKVELPLKGRKAQIANGTEVAIGDVVAANEDSSAPLIASIAGKADVLKTKIVIAPTSKSLMRYEIPGFKQLIV